jgi:endonuclease YncB( thermonuclease family)
MCKTLIFILALFAPIITNAAPAVVDYIIDGDTFAGRVALEDGIKISVRVRLINVDTPEMNGECENEIKMANAARDRLAELIPIGETVELSEIKDDKYLGRIDARVKTASGADVGEVLIKENLGRRYGGGKRAGWCD